MFWSKAKEYKLHESKYPDAERKELYEILGQWFYKTEFSATTNCAIAIEFYVDKLWEAGFRKVGKEC